VLAEYLRLYVNEDQTNWDEWVPFATYVYNTTVHSATGFAPFELLFGRPSVLPCVLKNPPEPQYVYDDYVSELRSRLQTFHHHAHKNLIASKSKSNEHYDKTSGEMNLLFDKTVRRGRSRKLRPQWIGPYTIREIDTVNATITRVRKVTKVHVNRLKPFY